MTTAIVAVVLPAMAQQVKYSVSGTYAEDGKTVYLNCCSQYDMLETKGPDRTVVLDLSNGNISLRNQPEEFAYDRDTTYEIEVADDLTATEQELGSRHRTAD